MPNVFVGHPFAGRFAVKKFRTIFRGLPFNVIYGNTDLQTRHLLTIMKSNIARADYSIFDLSNWNPNVALELGLAEGLKKKPAKNYYILLNTRRSKEVPSDIRGIQRLEYTSYDFKHEVGLGDQLVSYVLAKEYWVKKDLEGSAGGWQGPEEADDGASGSGTSPRAREAHSRQPESHGQGNTPSRSRSARRSEQAPHARPSEEIERRRDACLATGALQEVSGQRGDR